MKKMGSGIGARFRYTNDSDGAASLVVTDQTETGWSYHRGMWKTRKRHCHKREKRRKQKHASARWRGESGRGISKPVFCALRRTNFSGRRAEKRRSYPVRSSCPTAIACRAHHFPSSLYTWNWRPSALIEKAEKSAL